MGKRQIIQVNTEKKMNRIYNYLSKNPRRQAMQIEAHYSSDPETDIILGYSVSYVPV